eukprot:CAMPEP_0179287830 /NCGR_PEP_ID=MMETSP0797-20121207/40467_1 /TAXON_ID=47934 /ORGANISM="Dinophysis acuminata, Strain DAEP01" /LENGTH=290 /DNA_ID=CAMNT_0020996773 /DNA_START=44 /DNA_END=912 /DNA_ORIENTATION=-
MSFSFFFSWKTSAKRGRSPAAWEESGSGSRTGSFLGALSTSLTIAAAGGWVPPSLSAVRQRHLVLGAATDVLPLREEPHRGAVPLHLDPLPDLLERAHGHPRDVDYDVPDLPAARRAPGVDADDPVLDQLDAQGAHLGQLRDVDDHDRRVPLGLPPPGLVPHHGEVPVLVALLLHGHRLVGVGPGPPEAPRPEPEAHGGRPDGQGHDEEEPHPPPAGQPGEEAALVVVQPHNPRRRRGRDRRGYEVLRLRAQRRRARARRALPLFLAAVLGVAGAQYVAHHGRVPRAARP